MPVFNRFDLSLGRSCISAVAFLLVAGCASDEPLIPPAELTVVSSTVPISRSWAIQVGKRDKQNASRFRPALKQNTVYAASFNGVVSGVDASSGKSLWRVELKRRLLSGVGIDDNSVYVSDQDGTLLALNRNDGSIVWEYLMSSEVNAPVAAGFDTVIVRGADGRIIALESATGKERWKTSYSPPSLTIHGNGVPLMVGGGVLVGLDDGNLVALALESGRVLWETQLSHATGRSELERLVDIDADILVDDNYIYAVNYQGKLARLDPSNGRQTWATDMSSIAGMSQNDSTLFITDSSDHVFAVSKNNGDIKWKTEMLEGRSLTLPAFVNEYLALGDFEGYIHLLSSDDGTLQARVRAGDKAINVPPLVVQDAVAVQSTDAKLQLYRIGS